MAHDSCPDIDEYCRALGFTSLSSGLELFKGLFAPSLEDILGTSFMLAHLSSPAPQELAYMGVFKVWLMQRVLKSHNPWGRFSLPPPP